MPCALLTYKNLMSIVEDLYGAGTSFVSQDKYVVRHKKSTILKIDLHGRRTESIIDIDANYTSFEAADSKMAPLLFVIRTNFEVRYIPRVLEGPSWSFKFSRLEAYFLEQERELEVPVLYVRDAAHVRFLHELSESKDTATKPFHDGPRKFTSDIDAGSMGKTSNCCDSAEDRSQESYIGKQLGRYNKLLWFMGLLLVVVSLRNWIYKKKLPSMLSGSSKENGRDNSQATELVLLDTTKTNADRESGNKQFSESDTLIAKTMTGVTKVGQLTVFNDRVIGTGSCDTIILEGEYGNRKVAVKRFPTAFSYRANLEVEFHNNMHNHQHFVHFYGREEDKDFVYLGLERCICNLGDMIMANPTAPDHSGYAKVNGLTAQDLELLDGKAYPKRQLLDLMRNIVSGIEHLHHSGIIHGDLKPENILISKGRILCAKISALCISKCLRDDTFSLDCATTDCGTKGWRAPELLDNNCPPTRAVDLFGLGCVLVFCMTKGKHPFGEGPDREEKIRHDKKDLTGLTLPQAEDLCKHLLNQIPEMRPNASEVLRHPLFWDTDKCILFLQDVSDYVRDDKEWLESAVNTYAKSALDAAWTTKIPFRLYHKHLSSRLTDGTCTYGLVRLFRNKCHHPERGDECLIGSTPGPAGYYAYFTRKFPRLLIEVYKVMHKFRREEPIFRKYFEEV